MGRAAFALGLGLAAVLGAGHRVASADVAPTDTPRAGRLGLQVALAGEPFPSLVGAGAHYYPAGFLRLEANLGWIGAGAGLRLVIPGVDLTPVIGVATSVTYVGGEWGLGISGTLALQLSGRGGRRLEGGVSCAPGVLDGDFAECLPYLQLAFALRP